MKTNYTIRLTGTEARLELYHALCVPATLWKLLVAWLLCLNPRYEEGEDEDEVQ